MTTSQMEMPQIMLYHATDQETSQQLCSIITIKTQPTHRNAASIKKVFISGRKNTAMVGPYELEISRRNRGAFLEALAEYMGGNS